VTVLRGMGPDAQASFQIVLHDVTHPCPEDLAVLLVIGCNYPDLNGRPPSLRSPLAYSGRNGYMICACIIR